MGSQEKQNNAFPTFHRPLEISPNTVRFPHSHPTADEKIETLLTDSKKHQLDESVNHVPGLLCQLCPRLHNPEDDERRRRGTKPGHARTCVIRREPRDLQFSFPN
jgi:hypothetical protein